MAADAPQSSARSVSIARLKTRLSSLNDLDRRTSAFRKTAALISELEGDLGGDLSVAQKQLVQRIAVTSAMIEDIETRWLAGFPIDPLVHATLANSQRRLLLAIGLERRARDITPTLEEIARQFEAEEVGVSESGTEPSPDTKITVNGGPVAFCDRNAVQP